MKTIREHLESLQEPYRSQALHNLKECYASQGVAVADTRAASASVALLSAFLWRRTPERHAYWSKLYRSLKGK